ncbi:MAG: alkaline phosphatase, partial [Streptomycetaceae bacterium]|nr:alkaline phosphatase [Streptomycetaceae bacterium]
MTSLDRRNFLRTGTALGAGIAAAPVLGGTAAAAPAYVVSGRPELTHGVQSGDATADSAVVWGRADRPGR